VARQRHAWWPGAALRAFATLPGSAAAWHQAARPPPPGLPQPWGFTQNGQRLPGSGGYRQARPLTQHACRPPRGRQGQGSPSEALNQLGHVAQKGGLPRTRGALEDQCLVLAGEKDADLSQDAVQGLGVLATVSSVRGWRGAGCAHGTRFRPWVGRRGGGRRCAGGSR